MKKKITNLQVGDLIKAGNKNGIITEIVSTATMINKKAKTRTPLTIKFKFHSLQGTTFDACWNSNEPNKIMIPPFILNLCLLS